MIDSEKLKVYLNKKRKSEYEKKNNPVLKD